MSRSTESEAIPFKAIVWEGDRHHCTRDAAPEFLCQQLDHEEALDEDTLPRQWLCNGWTGTWGLEKYGCLYVTPFTKDKMVVYFVNEHEWANVGGITATYFADKKAWLCQFLLDNFPETKLIRSKSTVQQTL